MKGEIILPSIIPNLNQILLKGDKILEFNKPKTKKIREVIADHVLISPLLVIGYKAIIKNTIKKNNSKTSI